MVYFKFGEISSSVHNTFTFELTDKTKIQIARNILSGIETRLRHIGGIIIKEPIMYNQSWNFYLNPNSIYFFQTSMEVCDSSIQYVEDHLNEVGGVFLPNNQWCPWGSILIEELTMCSNINATLIIL
jgi:hypothetical protein